MKVTYRPDVSQEVVKAALERSNADYVSAGTAVVQLKKLTTCLTRAWLERMATEQGIDLTPLEEEREEGDRAFLLQILAGIGYERLLFERPGPRVEIPTPFGPISGRIDFLPGFDGDNLDMITDAIREWGAASSVWVVGAAETAVSGDRVYPWEMKVTWSSSKKSLDDQAQYVEQIAGYALALGVRRGRLFILNVAGDRSPRNMKPVLQVLDLEWTQAEMDAFRDELVRRTAIVVGPEIPPKAEKYVWECGYCPHNPKNGGACPNAGAPGKTNGFFANTTGFMPMTEMIKGYRVTQVYIGEKSYVIRPYEGNAKAPPSPSELPNLNPRRRIRRPLP